MSKMLYNICVRISLKGEKQMYIDDTEAKLLLETNRDNIGCSNRENIEMQIKQLEQMLQENSGRKKIRV